MNIFENTDPVLYMFNDGYKAIGNMRCRLIDNSVIAVCGLRRYRYGFFDVYYSCFPVFSAFETRSSFLNDATAYCVSTETDIGRNIPLATNPNKDSEKEVISIASAHAEYAYQKLNSVKRMDDCYDLHASWLENLHEKGIIAFPRYQQLDILINYCKYEKCLAVLENSLQIGVVNTYRRHGISLPKNRDWKELIPSRETDCNSSIDFELYYLNANCYKSIRLAIEHSEFQDLHEKLESQKTKNIKLLKRSGIFADQF